MKKTKQLFKKAIVGFILRRRRKHVRFRLLVNRQRRLTEQDKSLFKIPPDAAESSIVHDLFLKTISEEYVFFYSFD